MFTLFTVILPVIVLFAVIYGVLRSVLRIVLDHKLKLALLEKLERNPALLESARDIADLVVQDTRQAARTRQDYAITGLALLVIGVGCVLTAKILGVGRVAVGAYYGGALCIWAGLILGTVGVVIRRLSRKAGHPPKAG